jgi:hypothetical protein
MRALFAALLLMSVALGMLLLTALENWLQGNSFLWWLLLVLLDVFAVAAVSMSVLKLSTKR